MPTIATDPLVKEVHVDAEPDTVFAFFTEADKITRWLAADATTDPRPGGINHQTHQFEGVDYLLRGEFVELDRNHRVVFTWGFQNTEIGRDPGRQHRRGDADPRGRRRHPCASRALRAARAGALASHDQRLGRGSWGEGPRTGCVATTEKGRTQ